MRSLPSFLVKKWVAGLDRGDDLSRIGHELQAPGSARPGRGAVGVPSGPSRGKVGRHRLIEGSGAEGRHLAETARVGCAKTAVASSSCPVETARTHELNGTGEDKPVEGRMPPLQVASLGQSAVAQRGGRCDGLWSSRPGLRAEAGSPSRIRP